MSNPRRRSTDLSTVEKRALLEQALRKKASASRSFPLSYAQERLWFLDQWEPHNTAHNIFSALRLQGNLQARALERSLNGIVRRHEVLRTTFQSTGGQPTQVIALGLQVPLPVVDLRGLPAVEQEATLQRLALEESQRPFDLSLGPLLRATLLRVTKEEHVFLLTMHHSVSDGWSLSVFNRELALLYEAFSHGQPSPLPPLPIQYADYALWQRQRLQGEVLQKQLQYWRTQLRDAPTVLALPTDRPRPAAQTFAGATHQVILSASLSAALKTLSQAEDVTLFTTLLAAFQTLLARYSQQEDISVGTYIAGRTQLEQEPLIGFFINNLVLRTDLSGDPPFRALLKRASKVTQDAYANQEVPFEHLLQELKLERNPGHTPLFQVMLIYQNMPRDELTLPGLALQPLWVESTRSNFDLSLWVLEKRDEDKLYLTFEYNTDLFDVATIQRMAGHFQMLAHGIVDHPDERLSELSLLAAPEVQQVLHDWNATEADFARETSLDSLFEAQVERTPDSVAVVCEEEHLTYSELNRRAEHVACVLQSRGVGPEVPVGICLERGLEMLTGLLGILKAGGVYVPLDPAYPAERLAL